MEKRRSGEAEKQRSGGALNNSHKLIRQYMLSLININVTKTDACGVSKLLIPLTVK